jgi:hypothetical protein
MLESQEQSDKELPVAKLKTRRQEWRHKELEIELKEKEVLYAKI